MKRIVLLSLMPRNIPGGVARWVNDFMDVFKDREVVHFSVDDLFARFGRRDMSEWDLAKTLGEWLYKTKKVTDDDIFIVDGFWGLGIPSGPNVISVCHGTWARRVKSDLDKGIKMEFPVQMTVQKRYWDELLSKGGKIVAVSEFAQMDLKETWGIESDVINNAIDIKKFVPEEKIKRARPIIIHGVTSKVKAMDHIEHIAAKIKNVDIWLLDDAAKKLNLPKYSALAQADVIVIPSHYEGNSYFTLESLAVGVPVVCYDVGMPWWAYRNGWQYKAGSIIPYDRHSKDATLGAVNDVLSESRENMNPRELAELFPLERFYSEWNTYLEKQGR